MTIAFLRRRCTVASCFAVPIHSLYSRRHDGGNESKYFFAFAFFFSAVLKAGGTGSSARFDLACTGFSVASTFTACLIKEAMGLGFTSAREVNFILREFALSSS